MQANNDVANPSQQHQACAACKHQRKKCTENCILAPLFPASKAKEFQAVHKVFGVSNIQKIMKSLREEDRRRAADSLVWEANCRQNDPVQGSYGEYCRVSDELRLYKLSLNQSQNQQTIYKSPSAFIGWNINNNGIHNIAINGGINALNYMHNNANSGLGPSIYQSYAEKVRQERDVGAIVCPSQQHSITNFDPQLYLSGDYSLIYILVGYYK